MTGRASGFDVSELEALHHAALIDEDSTTSREGLPYAVSLQTALLAELLDSGRDIAVRQGKKGASLKKEERVAHGFQKSTIEKARRNQEELAKLKRQWQARQKTFSQDMEDFDTRARAYAETFADSILEPPVDES